MNLGKSVDKQRRLGRALPIMLSEEGRREVKTAVGLLCGTAAGVPDGERTFMAKGSRDMIRKVVAAGQSLNPV